jgi:hypothetical protein
VKVGTTGADAPENHQEKEYAVAGFLSKVSRFASSPQGRRAIEQARVRAGEMAKDPATRAKIDAGVSRVRGEVDKRRRGGGATPPPPSTPPPS